MRRKDLIVGGYLWGEVRGCLMLAPVSSVTDPPWAKAEPISEAGDASVKTDLRKGRKHQMEGGGRNKVRNKRGTARSDEEEEVLHGGAAHGGSIPEQIFPAACGRDCATGKPLQGKWVFLKKIQPTKDPHWRRFS